MKTRRATMTLAITVLATAGGFARAQSIATCTLVIDGAVAGNVYTAGNAVLCLLGVSSAETAPRWSVTRWDDGDGTVETGEGRWR